MTFMPAVITWTYSCSYLTQVPNAVLGGGGGGGSNHLRTCESHKLGRGPWIKSI